MTGNREASTFRCVVAPGSRRAAPFPGGLTSWPARQRTPPAGAPGSSRAPDPGTRRRVGSGRGRRPSPWRQSPVPGAQTSLLPGPTGRRPRPAARASGPRRFSPCARARPPGLGAGAPTTARRPPPRRERPAAASSSAVPPARRRPTDSSAAAAAADSHPRGADRRTGPGPSRWLLRAAAARSRASPPPAPPRLFL